MRLLHHCRTYACLVGLPVLALWGLLAFGDNIAHSAPVHMMPAQAAIAVHARHIWPVSLLIVQIVVVVTASRLFGVLFRSMGQPHVMGEMVAGIVLGPSVFGWLAPGTFRSLFPSESLDYINVLSQLGLVLFMFLVGLSLNPKQLREHGHAAVLTSHVSIVAPFVLGAALALYMYPTFSGGAGGFMGFALFIGAAMSITAFPVLARILAERNILHTRAGTLAIACAAVDDVTAWCILAYITVLIRSSSAAIPVWLTLGGAVAFVAVMWFVIRPLVRRLETRCLRDNVPGENVLVVIILVMLTSALMTEVLGIHMVFGAFCAGAIMPKNNTFVRTLHDRLESVTLVVFMPLFFAFTGLRTSIAMIRGGDMWAIAVVIVAVAVIGKMGGSMIAAHTAGMSWRDAVTIGALLNTRGLMELVILNIGLDMQVITPPLFTIMVIMALVTTFMTAPLLASMARPALVPLQNGDMEPQHAASVAR